MAEIKGTITAGGTPQLLYPATPGVVLVALQNTSAGVLTVALDNASVPNAAGPLVIPAGAYFSLPSNQPVGSAPEIWGATTGQTFTAWFY